MNVKNAFLGSRVYYSRNYGTEVDDNNKYEFPKVKLSYKKVEKMRAIEKEVNDDLTQNGIPTIKIVNGNMIYKVKNDQSLKKKKKIYIYIYIYYA